MKEIESDISGRACINGKQIVVDKEKYRDYFREYRKNNREGVRTYNRIYNQRWRKENGYHNEYNSKKRYPKKERARRILQRHVKQGKVQKQPCIVCKKKNSQAHHEDYSKPLDVIWFCALHHSEHERRCLENLST